MRWKTTLIVIALLAIVATWHFLVDTRRQGRIQEEETLSKRLLPYGTGEVDSVTFFNPDGDIIKWKRTGGRWLITSPAIAEGDPSAIDYMMDQMIPGSRKSEFDAGGNFADYGLASPFATIIFHNGSRGRIDTLGIGDGTPVGEQCYIRLGSSSNVIVAWAFTRNLVRKNLYHLRDKQFLHVAADSITGLSIGGGPSSVSFEKRWGAWLLKGTRTGADKGLIEPYITSIAGAIIREFASESAGDAGFFGIVSRGMRIALLAGNDTVAIEFGREENGFVYAVRSGLDKVVSIERKYLQIFDWLPEELMVFNLASFVPGEIARIAWETPGSSVTFTAKDGAWSVDGDPDARIAGKEIEYLLMILRGLSFRTARGERGPGPAGELAGDGSGSKVVRIVLSDSSGTVVDDITVTRLADGTEYGESYAAGSSGVMKKDSVAELARIVARIVARSRE